MYDIMENERERDVYLEMKYLQRRERREGKERKKSGEVNN